MTPSGAGVRIAVELPMADADLAYAGIPELARRLARRELSPIEVARFFLDRIAELDPRLHAFARVTPELALEQARQADAEIARGELRGPLHGVPVAVNRAARGWRRQPGSARPRSAPTREDRSAFPAR